MLLRAIQIQRVGLKKYERKSVNKGNFDLDR